MPALVEQDSPEVTCKRSICVPASLERREGPCSSACAGFVLRVW